MANFKQHLSSLVSNVGTKLKLPEFGISERISSNVPTRQAAPMSYPIRPTTPTATKAPVTTRPVTSTGANTQASNQGQQQTQQQYSYNQPSTPSIPEYNAIDPVEQARKLQEFMIQQNQPAIQTREAEKGSIAERYKSLIDLITGNKKVAQEKQTLATSR